MEQSKLHIESCDTRSNKDKADIVELAAKEQKLWIAEFNIKNIGKGCAVIKARNPKEAEALLKADGSFNGTPFMYDIIRIEEIVSSPDSMLIAEQIISNNS